MAQGKEISEHLSANDFKKLHRYFDNVNLVKRNGKEQYVIVEKGSVYMYFIYDKRGFFVLCDDNNLADKLNKLYTINQLHQIRDYICMNYSYDVEFDNVYEDFELYNNCRNVDDIIGAFDIYCYILKHDFDKLNKI